MKFLLKYTLRFLLLAVILVFLYEIGIVNYQHFTSHPPQSLVDNLKTFLENSIQAVNYSIELIHQGSINQLTLVKQSLYLFHNKIYWILLPLLLAICYYQYNKRQNKAPLVLNSKISVDKFKQESQRLTRQEVQKLKQSQKYKDYLAKKN